MTEAEERTLRLLETLDELLGIYDSNRSDRYTHAKIVCALRFINEHLDHDIICDIIDKQGLCHGDVIKGLLREAIFNPQ